MIKHLLFGLLKGMVVGIGVGAVFHFGLGFTTAAGLLAYLLAMGAGATAGVLAGKPPWKHEAWIESVLKAAFGVLVGAGVYWASAKWLSFNLPFGIPPLAAGTPWTESTLAISTAASTIFGTLVELDNTGDTDAPKKTKVRVTDETDAMEEVRLPADPREAER